MSNIIPISDNPLLSPQGNVQRASTDLFKNSLEKALDAQKTSGTPQHIAPLGEVRAMSFHPIETPAEKVAAQTGHLLDLLDNYAKDLGNPSKSLKDMTPLLEQISMNAQELIENTDKVPHAEEQLRGIASSAAITAQVELIKFKRGDYV